MPNPLSDTTSHYAASPDEWSEMTKLSQRMGLGDVLPSRWSALRATAINRIMDRLDALEAGRG